MKNESHINRLPEGSDCIFIYCIYIRRCTLNELRCVDRVGYDVIDCWFRVYYYDVDGRRNGVASIDRRRESPLPTSSKISWMTQDVDAFAMTVSYREDPPFVGSPGTRQRRRSGRSASRRRSRLYRGRAHGIIIRSLQRWVHVWRVGFICWLYVWWL
jgi:hypothetical protein